ncbi:MAG: hydrogenase maturation nickel metallochaperone HypA [Zoogloeaceae bacterium]|nr:hydrogenase maturation nickel metallochaperone HypA [Zoogloeaceae bacterium]
MHEMALAEEVRRIVEEVALAQSSRRVASVVLEIGELAAVEVDALRFCLDLALHGGAAEGASLEFVSEPGEGICPHCGARGPLHARLDPCARCAGYGVRPVAGTAMRVKAVEVA